MKTLAAVVDQNSTEFELRTLKVDEPGVGEVHIRFVASGLCHSDFHMIAGYGRTVSQSARRSQVLRSVLCGSGERLD
jgi:Zn-dependent alcohol dehydrogenase